MMQPLPNVVLCARVGNLKWLLAQPTRARARARTHTRADQWIFARRANISQILVTMFSLPTALRSASSRPVSCSSEWVRVAPANGRLWL